MKTMDNSQFAEAVLKMVDFDDEFTPIATYIREGDCIEFIMAQDDYYAQRLDGLVTIYYSRETGNIVGSLIKGVKAICKKIMTNNPGFRITIEGKSVKLEYLFLAMLWSDPNITSIAHRTYKELIDAAEQGETSVDLDDICVA